MTSKESKIYTDKDPRYKFACHLFNLVYKHFYPFNSIDEIGEVDTLQLKDAIESVCNEWSGSKRAEDIYIGYLFNSDYELSNITPKELSEAIIDFIKSKITDE